MNFLGDSGITEKQRAPIPKHVPVLTDSFKSLFDKPFWLKTLSWRLQNKQVECLTQDGVDTFNSSTPTFPLAKVEKSKACGLLAVT